MNGLIVLMVGICGVVLTDVRPARAERLPELTRYFEERLDALDDAVCADSSRSSANEDLDSWYFRRLFVRVRPKASFGIPGFAKLEIAPEVELIWQRDFPTGWGSYSP